MYNVKASRPKHVIVGLHLEDPLPGTGLLPHCGDEVCSRNHRIYWHQHDCFEFCYVSEGSALWRMGSTVLRQHPGEMLIAFPRQWHELVDAPHDGYHILYAAVDMYQLGTEGKDLARQLLQRRLQLLPRAEESETILRSLVRQAASQQPQREQVVRALLQTLIALTAQAIAPRPQPIPGQVQGSADLFSYPLQAAIAFMRTRLTQRLSTPQLAQVANFSAGHFARQFKREVGISPAEYHLRLRLEAARDELRQLDFSVTDVAMRYGFSSSQHFSRAFRQTFGMTPREWQQSGLAVDT